MVFEKVVEAKPDVVFGLSGAFRADKRPSKINLVVGIYYDEDLKAELIPVVKKAKGEILALDMMADYLPIDGMESFYRAVGDLVFEAGWEERIVAAEAVGGTGAIRIGAEFLAQEVTKKVWIPDPTWANHRAIFERARCEVDVYPYYDKVGHGFDFEAMLGALEQMEEGSCVVLHAVCQNPTGCDPTPGQWKEIALVMKKRRLMPFFDFAYHGFGRGLKEDREAVNLFVKEGFEMIVAYSCSKNFSLYCQRVGALFVVTGSASAKRCVASQVKRIIRASYSNPPAHGARIVSHILNHAHLKKEWEEDVAHMRNRLGKMRKEFVSRLMREMPEGNFAHLFHHLGMFSYLDLEKEEVEAMKEQFGIYMLEPGRVNVAGLTEKNMDYIVKSLAKVCAR